jgi:hypothetical protein
MRGIILILILAVVLAIAAFATGLLNLTPVEEGRPPSIAAQDGKVSVNPGEVPKVKLEAGKVAVGSGEATVRVPRLEVRPAGSQPAAGQPAAPSDNAISTNATQQ